MHEDTAVAPLRSRGRRMQGQHPSYLGISTNGKGVDANGGKHLRRQRLTCQIRIDIG